MAVKVGWFLLCFIVLVVQQEANGSNTVINTNADGTVNCDGMLCRPGSSCSVSSNTQNGVTTVTRKCYDKDDKIVKQETTTGKANNNNSSFNANFFSRIFNGFGSMFHSF